MSLYELGAFFFPKSIFKRTEIHGYWFFKGYLFLLKFIGKEKLFIFSFEALLMVDDMFDNVTLEEALESVNVHDCSIFKCLLF